MSLTHSDVGGYTSFQLNIDGVLLDVNRSEELVLRWMELSAFADCMFRSHEGNQADKQLQVWDTATLTSAFAKWSKIHSLLAPLRKKLMAEARNFGFPLVRGMWFKFGDFGWGMREQFMWGEYLLVAPVMDEGATEKEVWLPRGEWVNFNTCKTFSVEEDEFVVTVAAEVGSPPVFIDKGNKEALKVMKKVWKKTGIAKNHADCNEYFPGILRRIFRRRGGRKKVKTK